MCKFILIQGQENAGKTTACWKIYKDLVEELKKANGGKAVEHEFIIPDREILLKVSSVGSIHELNVQRKSALYQKRGKDSLDFIAILPTKSIKEYETNCLGIISAGDDVKLMMIAIRTCLKRRVDTIIMSIRSYKNTEERFCGDEYIKPFIEKESNHNIKYVNFIDCVGSSLDEKENEIKENVLAILNKK